MLVDARGGLDELAAQLEDLLTEHLIRIERLYPYEQAGKEALIRKYGYKGRLHTLELFERPECEDLRENMGVAAHLIHGSSDGRFSITYAVKRIAQSEIEAVGFRAADYDETAAKYDPASLTYGWNDVGGEEVYYIPNPALGLWIDRSRIA